MHFGAKLAAAEKEGRGTIISTGRLTYRWCWFYIY
ncbi:MAG: hypothetical protein CM1200mP13_04390 [Candidatus Pelagibacterales bacterium]|nr:MAG: hypothetical protein CM1200mP13_04390 [Pelagibacterales bacterium]